MHIIIHIIDKYRYRYTYTYKHTHKHAYLYSIHASRLSINILCAGNKSPMLGGFFKNSMGDLLPALRFLGRLYNYCNFVIIFSVI